MSLPVPIVAEATDRHEHSIPAFMLVLGFKSQFFLNLQQVIYPLRHLHSLYIFFSFLKSCCFVVCFVGFGNCLFIYVLLVVCYNNIYKVRIQRSALNTNVSSISIPDMSLGKEHGYSIIPQPRVQCRSCQTEGSHIAPP